MQLTAADLMDSAICALVYMERGMQHANLQSTAKLVAKGDIMALVWGIDNIRFQVAVAGGHLTL